MTAQIPDLLTYRGVAYHIAGLEGRLFQPPPVQFGGLSTGCHQGYVCSYACEADQLILQKVELFCGDPPPKIDTALPIYNPQTGMHEYHLVRPWPLDGRLVVVKNRKHGDPGIARPQPAYHAVVKELVFREGRLQECRDHSDRMGEIRKRLRAFQASKPWREWTTEDYQTNFDIMWSFAPGVRPQPPMGGE